MERHPIDILSDEHRVIEKVLAGMDRLAAGLDSGTRADTATVRGMVRFMRLFADARHHGKEEHRLFPALLEAGFPRSGGPVQVMEAEHIMARQAIGELDAAAAACDSNEAGAAARLAQCLRDVVALYVQHIRKEDTILFPMGKRALKGAAAEALAERFAAVEREHGEQSRQEFVSFADSLA